MIRDMNVQPEESDKNSSPDTTELSDSVYSLQRLFSAVTRSCGFLLSVAGSRFSVLGTGLASLLRYQPSLCVVSNRVPAQ